MSLRQAGVCNKSWSQRQTKHNQKRCRGERVADTKEGPAVVLHGIVTVTHMLHDTAESAEMRPQIQT